MAGALGGKPMNNERDRHATWRDEAIAWIAAALSPDEDVRGVALLGSMAGGGTPDRWSDVDVLVVVAGGALGRYHPATPWLCGLGEVYAVAVSQMPFWSATRAFLVDGRRIDCVVLPEASLARVEEWGSSLFPGGVRVLFSRCVALDAALASAFPPESRPPLSRERLNEMANDFRFKGMLAASKVARGDLPVALHLSLDMVRDCCVLAMMARDRRTGTCHHRDGSGAEDLFALLSGAAGPFTPAGILDSIGNACAAFDALAAELDPSWRPSCRPLLDWVAQVRASIVGGS